MLRGLLTEKSFNLSAAFTFVSGKYTVIRDKMREVMEDGRKLSGVVGGGGGEGSEGGSGNSGGDSRLGWIWAV